MAVGNAAMAWTPLRDGACRVFAALALLGNGLGRIYVLLARVTRSFRPKT